MRSPAALARATAPAAPGSRTRSAGEVTYSPSAGLTLIVPSRSRKMVLMARRLAGGTSGRPGEQRRLHHLADRMAQVQACFLHPGGVFGGDPDGYPGQRGCLPAVRTGERDRGHPGGGGRFERAGDIDRVTRRGQADHDVSGPAGGEDLTGEYLVIGV